MGKDCAVASFVRHRIAILDKQQTDIAAECGFEKPNIITMIKQGKTKTINWLWFLNRYYGLKTATNQFL